MKNYLRKIEGDNSNSQPRHFYGNICNSVFYGDTVISQVNTKTDETMTFYFSTKHKGRYFDEITDYDFTVGTDEQGKPYMDITFTAINEELLNNNKLRERYTCWLKVVPFYLSTLIKNILYYKCIYLFSVITNEYGCFRYPTFRQFLSLVSNLQ